MNQAKFTIKKSGRKFMWNLCAENGEVVLTSELYNSKMGAMNGIDSVRQNSQDPEMFEKRTSKANQPYFVLKGKNGKVIGTSEMYSSPENGRKGIESVERIAPAATIEFIGLRPAKTEVTC